MIVAQHEVLGRIFTNDTSRTRTGRSMAYADHSIAMPLRATKTFYRPAGTGRVSSRFPALRTGLLSQCPSGTADRYTCPTGQDMRGLARFLHQMVGCAEAGYVRS
jgi:hypothetical protein